MKRKIIPIILILVGILIMLYPHIEEMYRDYQKKIIYNTWETSMSNVESVPEDKNTKTNNNITDIGKIKDREVEGILKIDKIQLNLPILKGATEDNLKVSVASIKNTGKIDDRGNYAIAGHRSHTFGRNFNRLDEIEIGDIIQINSKNKEYKYIVTRKLYVKPEKVEVLNGNKNKKEVTLVTCDPMVNPYQRLIIKGEIIK